MKLRKILDYKNIGKVFLFFIFLSLLQIGVTYIFVRQFTLNQSSKSLKKLVNRIQHDIKFENGKWDMQAYNADPSTPYPHGSSGFSSPLYIITTEGFVIERNKPINDLLDSSDFKHLLTFSSPQTIEAITGEKWRVLALPINKDNGTVGVILVAYYNPPQGSVLDIDNKLEENIQSISSQIYLKDNQVNVEKIDVRNIHYDVAFEIVNKFNKVLINNGRTPSFIDPSYVASELQKNESRIVSNSQTNEKFIVDAQPVKDSRNQVRGIILAGQSIAPLSEILNNYLLFAFLTSIVIIIPLSFLTMYSLRNEIKKMYSKYEENKMIKKMPEEVNFDRKQSKLIMNNAVISIPYASNQYYLCVSLFAKPNKRFENDELLEKLGEDLGNNNWRTIYDSMISINKKAGFQLIIYQDKTYRLNPKLRYSFL